MTTATRTKSFLRPLVGLLCATLVLVAGCGKSAAPGKSTLLVYTPHGDDLFREVEQRFEKAHPDIDVQFLDISSQEILTRLANERANPQADLWWGASSLTFEQGVIEDVLEAYKPSWAAAIDPEYRNARDLWYGCYLTPACIIYNKEKVAEAEVPRDWDDLLDPKWRGKIAIRLPLQSDTMRTIFGAMILRRWEQSGNSPAGGYEWLRQLDANTKEYTTDGNQVMQKVGRGEALLTLWNLPDVVLHQGKGYAIGYTYPKSGTTIVTDGIGLVKGAPHPAAAKTFYEFVTSPDILVMAAQKLGRIPARGDIDKAQLPESMRTPIVPLKFDRALVLKESKTWMQYWEANIRGKGAQQP